MSTLSLNQVTVHVSDIDRSREFYLSLGLELIVSDKHYCRFIVPGNETTFSIHLSDFPHPGTTVLYFETDDLEDHVSKLQNRGIVFDGVIRDQPWLWKEIYFRDPDGNNLCLYHAGTNRLNPPWRIK
jgi:catechol 2,3-dioxygenase-like lactoylglutathione lyase family enzyme